MSENPVIYWFRQDLRLTDNPALQEAIKTGQPVLPLYILDDEAAGDFKIGSASRWWLYNSLKALQKDVGKSLCFAKGDAAKILQQIVTDTGADKIFFNRCYEPWQIQKDKEIKDVFSGRDVDVRQFHGSLLREPEHVLKGDGTPYKVFTAFYKNGFTGDAASAIPEPQEEAKGADFFQYTLISIDELDLLPDKGWYKTFEKHWTPGEQGAQKRLDDFFAEGLADYKKGRDYPAQNAVSHLSPHLHFGEISPRSVWYAAQARIADGTSEAQAQHFLRELVWREFSYSLLFNFPDLPRDNFQEKFDHFPWREDDEALSRWQKGMTGYPVVDAGMRELWQTGYMHNRVRMIVGSFLVKNLMLHWHHGEDWFWDTLLDADLANNSASWQWIAGCGADAAPYFRIFNPVTQGQKFDPDGAYVRRYVPELAALPDKYLHNPWEAPEDVLHKAKVKIGQDYPRPIVDLKASRERALAAFKSL